MIDIHTHILPGIDDGPANWTESVALARRAVEEGISTMIATPHHANERYENEASWVTPLVTALNRLLQQEGIPLTVLAGQEIRVGLDLLEQWRQEKLLTLAESRYILLEMPSAMIPKGMIELIHELHVLGLVPIIAHPERNAEIVAKPWELGALVEAGAYAQVTSHSLLGMFGRKIERTAWKLCSKGWVHLLSSDAHHADGRAPQLQEAYQLADRKLGSGWSSYFRRNAERIVRDELLLVPPDAMGTFDGILKKLGR